jgi:hypothetical protein
MTVNDKFNKAFSQKIVSVETIDNVLFALKEKAHWEEYLELLKAGACEPIKTHKSTVCLLTLYWLRFDEQLRYQAGEEQLPRDAMFLNDVDIPKIIFSEGRKCFLMIQKGDMEKENIRYLKYVIEAIGFLNVNKEKAFNFLIEVKDYFNTLEKNENIVALKEMINRAIELKRGTI